MRPAAVLLGLFVVPACGGSEAQRPAPRPVATVETTAEPEAAAIEPVPTWELAPWDQLLNREGVFQGALMDAQCGSGERAFVLVSGDDGFHGDPLAERAGCRIVGEVQHRELGLCCPETLRAPATRRYGSGPSCEAARQKYVDGSRALDSDEVKRPSAGLYGAVLNRGSYLKPCSLPDWMAVDICAAVVNGVAEGVSVRTFPASAGVGDCIADEVRKLEFPAHPRMDITFTKFSAD